VPGEVASHQEAAEAGHLREIGGHSVRRCGGDNSADDVNVLGFDFGFSDAA
jgi:hypothetical protein